MIIQNSCRSEFSVFEPGTFRSSVFSQLSYSVMTSNKLKEIRKRNNEHKQLKETFLLTEAKREQQENWNIDWINMKFYKSRTLEKSCPRPGIIQNSCRSEFSVFEPGTFRSSVWRSPNWAISAVMQILKITSNKLKRFVKEIINTNN